MTILAGIFAYGDSDGPDGASCKAMESVLSRDERDKAETFLNERLFLAKVDIGAFDEPAFHRGADGSVAALVGEPLIGDGVVRPSRSEDLVQLHAAWLRKDLEPFLSTHGTFSAVHYDPRRQCLALVADKLAARPLYWWKGPDFVVFSSAIRILEALVFVPKIMDFRGVAETIAFGYPLARRTQYLGIESLYGGEILEITPAGEKTQAYWKWDLLRPDLLPENAGSRELHGQFNRAIRRRLSSEESCVSCFLSGGLDSRCIAATLVNQGKTVHTFNFSLPGTYDQVLSTQFSEKLGSRHHARHMEVAPQVHPINYLPQVIAEDFPEWNSPPERPNLIWSGDGGSVGIGHVYLTSGMVQNMRAGRQDAAVAELVAYNRIGLPVRFLSRQARTALQEVIADSIKEELDQFDSSDPGRNLHVFLLMNDQRRHLVSHFENLDTNRIEMHLPFFDSSVLETVFRIPLDHLLYHRFYYEWLGRFPEVVTSVPWQAYPNHLPCFLSMPEGFDDQWRTKHFKARRGPLLARQLRAAMADTAFPSKVWSRPRLYLAQWLTALRARDYSYALQAALTSYEVARRCNRTPDPAELL